MLGVEAVLAGVLVAKLAAALALVGDVVEGTLGWGVWAGEGFEEGFDFFHGGRVAGGRGFGQWEDVRGDFGSWWRELGEGGLGTHKGWPYGWDGEVGESGSQRRDGLSRGGKAFRDKRVALRPTSTDGAWRVFFSTQLIATIDLNQ